MAITLPAVPRSWVAIGVVVLGVGVALYALLSRKSDEELIRDQLAQLAHVVRVDPDENVIFRAKRMKEEFEKIFTPMVRVDIRELTSSKSGRDQLVGVATRAGTYYRTVDLDIDARSVDVIGGGTSATVRGDVTFTGDRGDGPRRDERRVLFGFAKVDDVWLIDSVVVTPKDETPPAAPP